MLAACRGNADGIASVPTMPQRAGIAGTAQPGKYIRHIFIVVQENRSFDNLFAGYRGADAPRHGYWGKKKIALRPVRLEDKSYLDNRWPDALTAWDNGKMDGFGGEGLYGNPPSFPYAYVPRDEIQPYWALASQYVLADHMFPTEFGPSFTAHLDLIDGNTTLQPARKYAEADYPTSNVWGCDAPAGTQSSVVNRKRQELANGPFPCFRNVRTMADRLDAAHLTWRYYTPSVSEGQGSTIWSAFAAIRKVRYGADWSNVVTPEKQVLTDVNAAVFPNVVWVMPDWTDSDHPGNRSDFGPSWVASIVNSVGYSKLWKSSAIIILWDDWGGWYDNVSPPQLDFLGLGIRVPCIIVSPYARTGYVSHTQYEFGSILKFVEETFKLRPLGSVAGGYTDSRANSIVDSFDFTQKPRTFTAVEAKYSKSFFLHRPASLRAPDAY